MQTRILILFLFFASIAKGQMSLIIDPNSETFKWSGSVTTPEVSSDMLSLHLALNDWIGGSITNEGSGAFSSEAISTSGFLMYTDSSWAGRITSASQADGITSDLISFIPLEGGGTITFTGNETPYSYSDLPAGEIAFLGTLDGRSLIFRTGTHTTLGTAGTVVVVPEPASLTLIGGIVIAVAVLARRRRMVS